MAITASEMITSLIPNEQPHISKEIWQTLLAIVKEMRKENGCLDSNFYDDAENENKARRDEAVQADGKRSDTPAEGVPSTHPDEKDDQAEAQPSR